MPIEITYDNFSFKDPKYLREQMKGFDGNAEYEALNRFARDISWGTYTDELISIEKTVSDWEKVKSFGPKVDSVYLAAENRSFRVTFDDRVFNFPSEGIDHFIATIAGDVLTYSYFNTIEVADFKFSNHNYKEFFRGPNIGVQRLYKEILKDTINNEERPIIAYSIKPRMGYDIEMYKKICSEVAGGEIDIIEDDERIIDPVYCPFNQRVDVMAKIQNSSKTKFSVNITGPLEKMIERLEYAYSKGLRLVKIDVLVTGFDSLKKVADYIRSNLNSEVAVTCYPDANGMFRCLSRQFILKMARLCGADIIYTGTPQWARMDDAYSGTIYSDNIKDVHKKYKDHMLLLKKMDDFDINDSLPTISNGCDIANAELIQFIYRSIFNHNTFAFYVGGGISGFPATLLETAKEWMNCIKHTSTKSLTDYDNYKYKYEKEMYQAGIRPFLIKKEMGK